MSTNSQSSKVIVELDGLTLRENALYQITNKPDANAPNGFVEVGTTKLPSIGIANTVACRFIETNKNTGEGLFDTGLYEGSPMYANMDDDTVKLRLDVLNEYIVKPYEKLYGKGTLSHTNKEFWDSYGVHLYDRRMFTTNDPRDLLDLFIAVSSYELTPEGKQGHPSYKMSQYLIVDNEKVRTVKETRASAFIDAVAKFGALLENNRTLLVALLKYLGLSGVTKDSTEATLKPLFRDWIDSDYSNSETFMRYYDMTKTEKGKDLILTYSIVFDLAIKSKIKRDSMGNYEYNNVTLGADLKAVAKNLIENEDLQETKIQLFEIKI